MIHHLYFNVSPSILILSSLLLITTGTSIAWLEWVKDGGLETFELVEKGDAESEKEEKRTEKDDDDCDSLLGLNRRKPQHNSLKNLLNQSSCVESIYDPDVSSPPPENILV